MLKSDESTRGIPVILLSAKGRNVDQKVGFEVGADDYITKPFSPRKLVERINAILGHGQSQQRMQAAEVVRLLDSCRRKHQPLRPRSANR